MVEARIGITQGDPSGIGPEIILISLAAAPPALRRQVTLFGDRGVLERTAARLGTRSAGALDGVELIEGSALSEADSKPGRPSAAGARAQVDYLETAVRSVRLPGGSTLPDPALKSSASRPRAVDALVTGPISKAQTRAAGFEFPGHTEFLAERLGAREHAMMFVGPKLRVVLATIHVPLAEVPRILTPADIARSVSLGAAALARDLGLSDPRIGVLGLNPHAGEGGLFGREEADIVQPGIEQARKRLVVEKLSAYVGGPLVPDAAFRQALAGRWDMLVALYHDQGLIPVKLIDFEDAVNVTLGLPCVRTSPDHGVAYDIAGTGKAREKSFRAALTLAWQMAKERLMTKSSW